MVKIPEIKGRGAKLTYPFDKVTKDAPQQIKFTSPEQRKSIIAASSYYGKRHKIKLACRTEGDIITVYKVK